MSERRTAFEVQGHRGARGLMAENTLPGFEAALDVGVDSIETDVHLTADDVPVLIHDPHFVDLPGSPLIRSLTLAQLRAHPMDVAAPTPLAERFCESRGIGPFSVPTLAEFFEFVAAYANSDAKTAAQRQRAKQLVCDIELKRVPFRPETIGDDYDGTGPALLERLVAAAIRKAGILERVRVRSFDHRCVRTMKQLEPALQTGILIHETAPCDIGALLATAQADVYCPEFRFVDAEVVQQVHRAGKRIIPYTVNEPADWQRLISWGVDGITTDYPDRLIACFAPTSLDR